jgi:hypothetical protein
MRERGGIFEWPMARTTARPDQLRSDVRIRFKDYDPCFSKTLSAFFAVTLSFRYARATSPSGTG